MTRTLQTLRDDALAIWQAGVDAVRSERLVKKALRVEDGMLWVGDEVIALDSLRRIAVVGGGKAGWGMAAAVEEVFGPRWIGEKHVAGWVNVPEDCARRLQAIHLHPARPAGVNEPTEAGVAGAEAILRLVGELGEEDLCLCLISGGGSALLPAPVEGITLADKLAVTRHLSGAGATIDALNAVRKQLSRIKGGGLARACRAGRLAALIISDVLGDPLETIASGPTVHDPAGPEEARAVLERFDPQRKAIPPPVYAALSAPRHSQPPVTCRVTNHVIGNNATAVDAAGAEAVRRGYAPAMVSAAKSEGLAEPLGRHLAEMGLRMQREPGPDGLVSGGEPVVQLVESARRGRGGRNQQLVLAALLRLAEAGEDAEGIVVLSGGTDGEDGPTDAAGAFGDAQLLRQARQQKLDPADFLARNDAYHFFAPCGGLIRTGPTHTNVCDLRVVLVDREPARAELAGVRTRP